MRVYYLKYRSSNELRRIVGAEQLAEGRVHEDDAVVNVNVECIRRECDQRAVAFLAFPQCPLGFVHGFADFLALKRSLMANGNPATCSLMT